MRVAMYYNNDDVRIEEVPVPEIAPDEILVKVMASGICGSDVMEWYRKKKAPLVLGHEISGQIEEVGESVKKYKKGQRVFVSHHIPCNTCRYCLRGHHTVCETLHNTNYDPGGFSEFIRVPSLNVDRGVFVLPDEVSYEVGTFIEPVACVLRGQKLARLEPGLNVLIIGSGISGLIHLLTAKDLGAGRIIATDVNKWRLNVAKELGADAVINAKDYTPEILREVNAGLLADLVIICTGATSAFTQALRSVDKGGTILFFAPTLPGVELAVPVNDFWRNGITLMPSYGNSPLDADEAIALLASGRVAVEKLITHRLGLEEAAKGFKLVQEAAESIKVILKPH